MTEAESFKQIDVAINLFKENEGSNKRNQVLKKPHGGWLVFNWRQLNWTEKGVNKVIEIFPAFDDKENIASWSLYAAAYFDKEGNRHYTQKTFVENTTINKIAAEIHSLICVSYMYLANLTENDIPVTTRLR